MERPSAVFKPFRGYTFALRPIGRQQFVPANRRAKEKPEDRFFTLVGSDKKWIWDL
jgi:hypothetical protein